MSVVLTSLQVAPDSMAFPGPGVIWSAALLTASGYAVLSARRSGLDARAMYWAVVCALLPGLWGAHLLSLLVHGGVGSVLALFEVMGGGKSLFGGLLMGGLAAGIYFHIRKLPVWAYADAAIPGVALGYAIGRVGCFLNGDDFGTVTRVRWAVAYPPGTEAYEAHLHHGWISATEAWSLPIHPVQMYSSLLGLVLFVLLASWHPVRPGRRLCVYLMLYGLGRFLMEFLRGDFRAVLGGFSLPQLFSAAFVLLGAGVLTRMQLARPTGRPIENSVPMSRVVVGEG